MNRNINTEPTQSPLKKLAETDENGADKGNGNNSHSAFTEYMKSRRLLSLNTEASKDAASAVTNGIKTCTDSKERAEELPSLMDIKASPRLHLFSRLKTFRAQENNKANNRISNRELDYRTKTTSYSANSRLKIIRLEHKKQNLYSTGESDCNLKLVNNDTSKHTNHSLVSLSEIHIVSNRSTSRRNNRLICSSEVKHKPIIKKEIDIDDLLSKKSVELVKYLISNIEEFSDFLSQELSFNDVTQTIFVLAKVCNAKSDLKFSVRIYTAIYGSFCKLLDSLLLNLSIDNDKSICEVYWRFPDYFWEKLHSCFNFMQKNIPKTKLFLLKTVKLCLLTVRIHKTFVNISTDIENAFNAMFDLLYNCDNQEEDFVDAFRLLDPIPSTAEIVAEKRQFIRKNIVEGPYESVSHFLDTHFRLLREDFVGPLRSALFTYKNAKISSKITEFLMYSDTQFIGYPEVNNYDWKSLNVKPSRLLESTCEIVKIGTCTNRQVLTKDTFMVGSLLLFSDDDFKTVFFGIVKDKRHGRFVRVFLLEAIPFMFKRKFMMLECTTYFGPYNLVLKVLKQFDIEHFPMKSYILNVSSEQHAPAYLNAQTRYVFGNQECVALNPETWPSPNYLKLNEAQYEAFRYALTSEFSVIQGPPGTGKTYLGIKIAGELIKNKNLGKHKFSDEDLGINMSRPILVVAYTNHALDQFLEGLLCYTSNIVRIGLRSKNPIISRLCFKRSLSGKFDRHLLYSQIETTVSQNETFLRELEYVLLYAGIYSFNRLAVSNSDLKLSKLQGKSDKHVIKWLMGNRKTKEKRAEDWQMTKEISSHARKQEISYCKNEYYIKPFHDIKEELQELRDFLAFKDSIYLETIFENWNDHQKNYDNLKDDYEYLHWRLSHAAEHSRLYGITPISLENPNKLNCNERWILYFHWINNHIDYLKGLLGMCNSKIQNLCENIDLSQDIIDSVSIKSADVVGMTTSGAACHRTLLEKLKCPIVIVEEAAEVLESHIIVSLTHHCQQLILLGDHQQLRPSTADYEIGNEYKLGISLFERMILNGVCYKTLLVQHRMRPEICNLIVPVIYPKLINHQSVLERPNIIGIKHNMFFVSHTEPEEEYGNSKRNIHEAEYLIALARHLILQGYNPSEITILTTYKGQMLVIKSVCQNAIFQPVHDVKVMTVDDFQGEENLIILLSLVRSNERNKIGFIANENRICVSLSRAKEGLFIIGNMKLLANNSKTWADIAQGLWANKQIGDGLELACHLHQDDVTIVAKPSDFNKVPDGGCKRHCNTVLDCGHVCTRKCHVTDLDHKNYMCNEFCTKIICDRNHRCRALCYEKCSTTCKVIVLRSLPCNHEAALQCHIKTELFKCDVLISTVLGCGHIAQIPCFIQDQTGFRCDAKVNIMKPECGHVVKKMCYENDSDINCAVPVACILSCGHEVELKCYDQNKKVLCRNICLQVLQCGHICKKTCHFLDDPQHYKNNCNEVCNKRCSHNFKCTKSCSELCSFPCNFKVRLLLFCGHLKNATCGETVAQQKCKSYCKRLKECGHVCYSRCHSICSTECSYLVYKKLPRCKHTIKMPCSANPADEKCEKCRKFK